MTVLPGGLLRAAGCASGWTGARESSECPFRVPQWVRDRETQRGSQTWAVSSTPQVLAVGPREAAWGEERAGTRGGQGILGRGEGEFWPD